MEPLIKKRRVEGLGSNRQGITRNFLEYAKAVREYLSGEPHPDTASLQALCRQLNVELSGNKFRTLADDQKCGRHIEFMLRFLTKQMEHAHEKEGEETAPIDASDFSESARAVILLYTQIVKHSLGNLNILATSLYASRVLEGLFRMYPLVHRSSLHVNHLHEEVAESWKIMFAELTDDKVLWVNFQDANATCVLRTLITSSIGRSTDLNEKTGLSLGPKLTGFEGSDTMGQQICDLCLKMWSKNAMKGGQPNRAFVIKTLYKSAQAAPTLQMLLLSLKETGVADAKKVFGKLLPNEAMADLEEMTFDSKAGIHTLEFLVKNFIPSAELSKLVSSFVLPNLKRIGAHKRANYMLQAIFRSSSLSPKSFMELISAIDIVLQLKTHAGVIWAATEGCLESKGIHKGFVDLLHRALVPGDTSIEDETASVLFWSRLTSLDVSSHSEALTPVKYGSPQAGYSIAQTLLKFPHRALSKNLKDGLVRAITCGPVAELAEMHSYFVQACLGNIGKTRSDKIVEALTPHALKLAYHPRASFVLSEMVSMASTGLLEEIHKQLKPHLEQIKTRNFALYTRLNVPPKVPCWVQS